MPRRSIALVAFALFVASAPFAQQAPRLLLISIDGLMPASYLSPGSMAPTLRKLASQGAFAAGVSGIWPTNTRPSHATLLTGVPPAIHGIVANHPADPEGKANTVFNWFAPDIKVPTLVSAARSAGRSTAVVMWPLAVGMEANYLVPSFNWQHPHDLSLLRSLSTPRLLDDFQQSLGVPFDWPPSDRQRVDLTAFIERTYHPDVMLLYFGTLDEYAHTYGWGAAWTDSSLREIDRLLAKLLASLAAMPGRDETFVAIVSDHGYLPVEQAVAPNVALKQAGLIETDARGRVTAWQAFSHGEGGSSLVYVKDRADAALLARVRGVLDTLRGDPRSGIDRVLDARELNAVGADPAAVFGIEMKPGFGITPELHSLFQPPYIAAIHGYPPTHPEMNASFILSGPGVDGIGNVGTVRLTQVGPTLARLIGVSLSPQADQPIEAIVRRAP